MDLLILCGLHAKHPDYRKKDDMLNRLIDEIFFYLDQGQPVYCRVRQLSKGVELLKMLNDHARARQRKYPVYLENSVLDIVRKMERLSVPIMSEYNYSINRELGPHPHIVVGGHNWNHVSDVYKKIAVDFSLHEDFKEVTEFIKRLNPAQAVIVHCGKEDGSARTVEQQLMYDGDCRTQFIFPEEKEIYRF